MTRKKWYQGLIYLVAFLYISTVWITSSDNDWDSLVPLSILFDVGQYGFICWFLWKIQERKLNVEGLVGLLILLVSHFVTDLLFFNFHLNKLYILVIIIGICSLSTFILLMNVELKQLLLSWKSRRSWQTGTCFLGLGLSTFELSNYSSPYFAVSSDATIHFFIKFAFDAAVVLLFLILLTKKDLKSLKLYSTILLLLCSVKIIAYFGQPYYSPATLIFYFVLSIYQVCRVNGVFDKYAIEAVAENGLEEISEISEIELLKLNGKSDEMINENPEGSENQADSGNYKKGLSLNSPWLLTSLAITVLSLSFLFIELINSGSYASLYIVFAFIHYGFYLIATILLWLGMKSGRTGFLTAAIIFFGLSFFWTRRPVSIFLVILIWFGSRGSKEKGVS
ncbi:hypothetical protein [Streptococcus sp.]